MTEQETKKRLYFHGECVIAELRELPQNLKARNDKDSIMMPHFYT